MKISDFCLHDVVISLT